MTPGQPQQKLLTTIFFLSANLSFNIESNFYLDIFFFSLFVIHILSLSSYFSTSSFFLFSTKDLYFNIILSSSSLRIFSLTISFISPTVIFSSFCFSYFLAISSGFTTSLFHSSFISLRRFLFSFRTDFLYYPSLFSTSSF